MKKQTEAQIATLH